MSAPAPTLTLPAHRCHLLDRFVHELVVALLNLGMHAPDSQLVRDSLRDVVTTLEDIAGDDTFHVLRLEIAGAQLRACGRDLVAASLQASLLLSLCQQCQVSALRFAPGLGAEEVGRLLTTLLREPDRLLLDALLQGGGVRHISVEFASEAQREDAPACNTAAAPTPGLHGYRQLTAFLHDNHVAAFRGEDLQVARAQGVVEQAISHIEHEPSSLLALASYDDIDSFTVGHSVRVALLALHVARAAGVRQADLVAIGTAALLHDIGKSRVPQAILCKRGPLDDEEWRIMAQHPRLGAEILLEQRHLDPRAIGAAFCHHMTPDGGGYPTPALPFTPSEVSKLVRVCDVFEALTAVRPYKKALTPVQAYAVMFKNARDFDPNWLRFFARTIGLYPLGTRVILDNGAEASVVAHGNDPERPFVQVKDLVLLGDTGGARFQVGADHDGRIVQIAAVLGAGADHTQAREVLRAMHCAAPAPHAQR
jgi:putative nucleotidyltransferase with HDIG domain